MGVGKVDVHPLGATEVGVRRSLGAIVPGCRLAETLWHPAKEVLCGRCKGTGLLVRQVSGDHETGFARDKGGDPTPILRADHRVAFPVADPASLGDDFRALRDIDPPGGMRLWGGYGCVGLGGSYGLSIGTWLGSSRSQTLGMLCVAAAGGITRLFTRNG